MNGTERTRTDGQTYSERLEKASAPIMDIIEEKFPDPKEREEATDVVNHYMAEVKDVYLEIGLRCGIKLGGQLPKGRIIESGF